VTSAAAVAGPGVDRYRLEFEGVSRRSTEPSWLRERREAAFDRFAERGFPTPRDEAWRQTSVARIAGAAFARAEWSEAEGRSLASSFLAGPNVVFANGRFNGSNGTPSPSRNEAIPGVEVLGLRQVLAQAPERLKPHLAAKVDGNASAFADLNTALHEDGAVVFLAPGTVAKEPIHIVFASTGAPGRATVTHPRVLVVAGRGSRARIVESYLGAIGLEYLTNAVTEVRVEDGAEVEHYRLQQESEAAFHIGRLAVDVGREGRFTDRSFSFGAALARLDVDVSLAAEGGDCTLEGLFFASGDRHTDVHTRVDHAAPRCSSRELYKGVLDGHGRGVFHGLVVVRPGAQKTDAVQNNRNLLLSRDALVSSTPQLDILADDVKCKHGSTTGQLDAAAVFYLRSRGIGEAEARGLLTRAFAGELVGKIGDATVRAAIEAELSRRLGGGPSTEEDAA
jgi:Fe-S cluster assembly protein SufD